jgi:hypothetical protein
MARKIFEEDAVMTGLCLWEAWLEFTTGTDADDAPLREELEQLREDHGTFTCRQAMIDLISSCDAAYEAAAALGGGEYGGAFDWDFCPIFLREHVLDGRVRRAIEGQTAIIDAAWKD